MFRRNMINFLKKELGGSLLGRLRPLSKLYFIPIHLSCYLTGSSSQKERYS